MLGTGRSTVSQNGNSIGERASESFHILYLIIPTTTQRSVCYSSQFTEKLSEPFKIHSVISRALLSPKFCSSSTKDWRICLTRDYMVRNQMDREILSLPLSITDTLMPTHKQNIKDPSSPNGSRNNCDRHKTVIIKRNPPFWGWAEQVL